MAKPLTDEGVEETGVPGENPWRRVSENSTCNEKRQQKKDVRRLLKSKIWNLAQ